MVLMLRKRMFTRKRTLTLFVVSVLLYITSLYQVKQTDNEIAERSAPNNSSAVQEEEEELKAVQSQSAYKKAITIIKEEEEEDRRNQELVEILQSEKRKEPNNLNYLRAYYVNDVSKSYGDDHVDRKRDSGQEMVIEFSANEDESGQPPEGGQMESFPIVDRVKTGFANREREQEENVDDNEGVDEKVEQESQPEGEEESGGFPSIMDQELAEIKAEDERIAKAIYNDIHLAENKPAKPNGVQKPGHFPYNVLLLGSMGRTGSSFLGGLLNSQQGVLYFFEPFHDIEARDLLTERSAVDGLKGIFTCDIQDPLLSTFREHPTFSLLQYYKLCGKNKVSCMTPEVLRAACKKKSIRVVKTIRTRVSWLEPILNDGDVNMKIIHLVRDPRASIISGWDIGWTFEASKVCQDLTDDLQNGVLLSKMYPNKYMAVRYEDLCEDPWGMAKHIFTFLGYEKLPDSTVRFLKKATSGSVTNDAYSIRRNTKQMQQKWRSAISEKQLLEIEGVCADVIKNIGFQLFKDFNTVRNFSVPLYVSQHQNELFKYDHA